MDFAGVREASGMWELAHGLRAAVRVRPRPPADARELCRALCEEMSAWRGGRPVQLRFERFPDEIEVTGLWMGFRDFDLVIVEERAEGVQQLVILGHELWHLHVGHSHHYTHDGSRAADEAEADEFGHRLAATLRPFLPGAAVRGSGRPPLGLFSPRTPAGAGPFPRRGRPGGSPPPGAGR